MIEYFNNNSFDLLQNIILYVRKQLKVPDYSQIFEEDEEFKTENFDKETEMIFAENPLLLPKLKKLQVDIIGKIFNIIDLPGSEVQVSLLVYSNFSKLTSSDVKTEWRSLEMLRTARSSFIPEHN